MAIISFTTQFDFTSSPKLIVPTDTSDYAGQGISTSNVNGSFRIVAPDGTTIYNNTDYGDVGCDIKVSTSTIGQQTISFTPVLGTYTIIYTVFDINASEFYTVTNTYNNQYEAPTINITQTVDCIAPLFSQVDETNYTVAGVTPTKTTTNTLYYPVGSAGDGTPVITFTETLSTVVFYQGPQQSQITSVLTYVFSDGLTVNDTITGAVHKDVDCTYYCSISCCVTNQERLMSSYRGVNQKLFDEQHAIFTEVSSYLNLIKLAIECGRGQSTDVSDYMDIIKTITKCTDNCDCGLEDNSRVIGFGSIVGANGTNGTNGTNGSNGTNGADGTAILFNSITVDTPSTGSYSSLKNYTLPANTLVQDGDALEILYTIQAVGLTDTRVKMNIAGVKTHPKLVSDMRLYSPNTYLTVKATVTRKSTSTVLIAFESSSSDEVLYDSGSAYVLNEESITINDLTASTNLIDIQGFTTGSDTVVCKQLLIKKLLK